LPPLKAIAPLFLLRRATFFAAQKKEGNFYRKNGIKSRKTAVENCAVMLSFLF
jgi:hypothetical protein